MIKNNNTILKIFIYFTHLIFFFSVVRSDILYEKDNLIITKYDLEIFNKFYLDNFNINFNNNQKIKNIVLIKKLLKRIENNNSEILKLLDQKINSNTEKSPYHDDFELSLLRFKVLRNEFINEYFYNQFTLKDLKIIIAKFENYIIQLSKSNCLFVDKTIIIKEVNNFENIYIEILKNNTDKIFYELDNIKYQICINSNLRSEIEFELINYIEIKTEDDFKKILYEK